MRLATTRPFGVPMPSVEPVSEIGRVALLVRGDRAARAQFEPGRSRLAPIFEALADVGVRPVPCVFSESLIDEVRRDLSEVDGVLVWVDPVSGSDDRTALDDLLREIAAGGRWVSAHPDVILRMGTKQVLYDTRDLGWGCDVDCYRTLDELRARFPARLGHGRAARALKQYRGNGGIGVWKVEPATRRTDSSPQSIWVRVQGARHRDESTEEITLDELIDRCADYFRYERGEGRLIDQPFQPRIRDGIIRCYLVKDEVVGFCRQYASETADPERVFGLPSAKTMFAPDDPAFTELRRRMQDEWVHQMQQVLDVDDASLPLLWDADFMYGEAEPSGRERYVLCEINVSCVIPFPSEAPAKLAAATAHELRTR